MREYLIPILAGVLYATTAPANTEIIGMEPSSQIRRLDSHQCREDKNVPTPKREEPKRVDPCIVESQFGRKEDYDLLFGDDKKSEEL